MSNLEYYYDIQTDRWFMDFDGDTILSCSNEKVEEKMLQRGFYTSRLECFKSICAGAVMNLIDNVDLTFSMKWVLTHMFKYDICSAKGGK